MNDIELLYERNKNLLRNEFSASLRNATPEQQRWIERQISRAALDRAEEAHRKLAVISSRESVKLSP